MSLKKVVVHVDEVLYNAIRSKAEVGFQSVTGYLSSFIRDRAGTEFFGVQNDLTKNVVPRLAETSLSFVKPEVSLSSVKRSPTSDELSAALGSFGDNPAPVTHKPAPTAAELSAIFNAPLTRRQKYDEYNAEHAAEIAAMSPAESAIYFRTQEERINEELAPTTAQRQVFDYKGNLVFNDDGTPKMVEVEEEDIIPGLSKF